uniref:Uncharacterized protein n=1 Tax=Cyprinus carpio carpio TaxID=630221 RepID=A0A8C1BGZ8_CYPCA
MGLQAIIHTIMMGKMEMVFPDMYMMKRFMGICFSGPSATSQLRSASCTLVSGTGLSEYPTGYMTSPSLLCLSPRFLLRSTEIGVSEAR